MLTPGQREGDSFTMPKRQHRLQWRAIVCLMWPCRLEAYRKLDKGHGCLMLSLGVLKLEVWWMRG